MHSEKFHEFKSVDWIDAFGRELEEHREWLASAPHLLKRWKNNLRNPEAKEGAICEALLREHLALHVERIEPGEGADGSGLDFRCFVGDEEFYVECNCIGVETAAEKTGIPMIGPRTGEAINYSHLTTEIQNRCRKKGRQLSEVSGSVRLLAIATLHSYASITCFDEYSAELVLTSETLITFEVGTDSRIPIEETRLVTDLSSSSFLKSNVDDPTNPFIDEARQYLSGILLVGFGYDPPIVKGILHPNPATIFNRNLLPNIKFCQLKDGWKSGTFEVEWI